MFETVHKSGGRNFHATGPDMKKARSPNFGTQLLCDKAHPI